MSFYTTSTDGVMNQLPGPSDWRRVGDFGIAHLRLTVVEGARLPPTDAICQGKDPGPYSGLL